MINNYKLILPYATPYFVYVIIASLFSNILPFEVDYTLRIILTICAFAWAWRWYFPVKGPNSTINSVLTGVLTGIIGLILWIILLYPFVSPEDETAWSYSAFLLRLVSAGVLVPIFEEILMRGYIFRLAVQWSNTRKSGEKDAIYKALHERSVNDVKQGDWSWAAVLISTVAFTSGHQIYEWPASIVYGLLMAFLYIFRKDLLSCIIAHATTNIALAIYVFNTGKWQYW